MRRVWIAVFSVLIFTNPLWAYHIEVLQIADIKAYEQTYKGFIDELAKNGIVQGDNLTINRYIIDADADAGLWKKIGILMKIKKTASKIVDAKPDLVLTVSTPGTKYSKDRFIKAGIPVVFTCVANPPLLGCPSVEQPLPGITGATLYMDPLGLLAIAQMIKPDIKDIGIVHSDDDNAVAFAEESRKKSSQLGITISTRQVEKSESIISAAMELIDTGIEAFAIPLDQYYGLRNLEPTHELIDLAAKHEIPIFCFANFNEKGALIYVGSEFEYNGMLAAKQASAILKQGKPPEELPILKQEKLNIYIDKDVAGRLGIVIPPKLLEAAKPR